MPTNENKFYDNPAYKEQALKAVQDVFVKEYKNSIGIPLPEIKFIFPDSDNYKTGEYYISIDETWQINLNFGLLPTSYKEFQEEVRVLTRHEVGHYMCCPFDIITHFRMLKSIIDVFNKYYVRKFPALNIIQLAGSLSNQAADIIVDTVNFNRNKPETLKSEITWIKKGSGFHGMPRHNKLMFLTKQTLWEESLELEETDEELLVEVKALSDKFEKGGIGNKEYFLEKVEAYTHTFFKLFEQDIQEQQQDSSSGSGSGQSQNGRPQQGQQSNGQGQSQGSGQPQPSPSKDSQQHGSQFIFQSPDKVQEALAEIAQVTSMQMFNQILSAAGFNSLSEKDKEKMWFEAQSADIIPIDEESPIGSNDNYSYPTTWKLGDPIEDIDMMLTFANSPVFIPGITTKKWEQNSVFNFGNEKKQPDLLLVVDTSGSMGNVNDSNSNMHQAILASYGLIHYFESKQGQVALIGFSDKITADIEWTKNYDEVKDKLLISGSGGTKFPIQKVQNEIVKSKNAIVTVIITDGEIQNIQNSLDFFREYLNDGNKLYIFLQNRKTNVNIEYIVLRNVGAKIIPALTAKEMCESVLDGIYEN